MPTTAYYLTIETRDRYDATEYVETIAGRLANALQTTLQDTHKLAALTNCTSLSNPRIEVEVAQSERPQAPDYKSAVVARVILLRAGGVVAVFVAAGRGEERGPVGGRQPEGER